MARRYVDCRDYPTETGCTLAMSGEEKELLEAAVHHAIKVHGEADTPELRKEMREFMREEPAAWAYGTAEARP